MVGLRRPEERDGGGGFGPGVRKGLRLDSEKVPVPGPLVRVLGTPSSVPRPTTSFVDRCFEGRGLDSDSGALSAGDGFVTDDRKVVHWGPPPVRKLVGGG